MIVPLISLFRYRQVDPAKLNTLKDLINAPNYKDNLATLIRTIYEFAFLTYAGKIVFQILIKKANSIYQYDTQLK